MRLVACAPRCLTCQSASDSVGKLTAAYQTPCQSALRARATAMVASLIDVQVMRGSA